MRLLCTSTSPFHVLSVPENIACTPLDVAQLITPHVRANGYIGHLCLEFEGQYVPLVHEDEARLASELLAIYHNSCAAARLSVHPHNSNHELLNTLSHTPNSLNPCSQTRHL